MYLYGASGHGKVIAEIAEECNILVKGFIDGNKAITAVLEYKVIASDTLGLVGDTVISIGNNKIRKLIATRDTHLNFVSILSPRANISKRTIIEEGTVVMMGATINSEVKIGKHCIINTNASVDHDCVLEDYVHISPNVALAGNVEVGEGTHIGVGASVIQGIKIGKWCTVGAGTVIIKDIPDYAVVVGNPGKIIKYNETTL
ncbi:acetyltransferase [Myroides odoratimimus]|uniref:acetyltransferase n=1 Tax=Myroides odoratimimus TaxID=76832 RepID=UPI0025770EBC|nr:acetyltransferase [Myroides odoratimimus]MDM1328400.1 acetyltransferase [Myroides odoratimimus]